MNKLFAIILLSMTMSSFASIEYVESEQSYATEEEIAQSRACFREVADNGCGDPGDDPRYFKTCLKNVKESLSKSCKDKMTELYGK